MSTDTIKLQHGLIVPNGKAASGIVSERHEMVLLFEAKKANPNGDPDAENMPRIQPNTLKGLVTDVCLKRKIRNFFSLYKTNGDLISKNDVPECGYDIFIRENAILQKLMESPSIKDLAEKIFEKEYKPKIDNSGAKKKSNKEEPKTNEESFRDALCQTYYDIRTFGGVLSTTGPLNGSFYGQVRGPIQFSFAESLDKVLQMDFTITRCCSTSKKEEEQLKKQSEADEKTGGNRTMGRKYNIDYGLYRTHIYFSPAFAAKTGFSYFDLDNFLFALTNMFIDDTASSRPERMRIVGLVDFQHSRPLGNAHAHELFKKVEVKKRDEKKEFPESLEDYWGNAPKNGQLPDCGQVTANRIIWDISAISNV